MVTQKPSKDVDAVVPTGQTRRQEVTHVVVKLGDPFNQEREPSPDGHTH